MSFKNADRTLALKSTPIETHCLSQRCVLVKRDDLCSSPPAPPLGKLRGLQPILERLVAAGHKTIGCWDTRVSKLGIGLAAFARQFSGVKAIVCYPHLQNGTVPETIKMADSLGAEIVGMRGNHVSICFAQASKTVEGKGGVMLPFGLECEESVNAIAAEAATVPRGMLRNGTVVVSCGSAVTLSGLIKGLYPKPRRIIGISSGRSVSKLRQCLHRFIGNVPDNVTLVPASIPYNDVPNQTCPFPTHANYDLKAWHYLAENINSIASPVLFWNIGA